MGTPFARAGQLIADRFELSRPADHQPNLSDSSAWIALDRARSLQVRALVLDPAGERVNATIDAARRTSFISGASQSNPAAVSIMSVVADDTPAIITEIPPGTPLSAYLTGTGLDPTLVHSIMGEVVSAVNAVRHHGIRHLQLSPSDIFITDSGNVVIDGYGVKAALAGIDTSRPSEELDQDEARGLTTLLASLLLGRDETPATSETPSADTISEARAIDGLPDVLSSLLDQELDGERAESPDSLMLRLAPWSDLDTSRLPEPRAVEFAADDESDSTSSTDAESDAADSVEADPDATDPNATDSDAADSAEGGAESAELSETDDVSRESEPQDPGLVAITADTRESAAGVVEELLDLHGDDTAPVPTWPTLHTESELRAAIASVPESEPVENDDVTEPSPAMPEPTPVSATPAAATPAASETSPDPAVPDAPVTASLPVRTSSLPVRTSSTSQQPDEEPTVNASAITIWALGLLVFLGAILGLRGLFKPFDDVTLSTPDSTPSDTIAEDAVEEPAPESEPLVAPVISSLEIVNPDISLFGWDPAEAHEPERLPNLLDSDPSTTWLSWWYGQPTMSPSSGFGIYVQLAEDSTLSQVEIDQISPDGGNIQIRDTVRDAPSSGKLLAEGPGSAQTVFTLDEPAQLSEFVIWFTEMPPASDGQHDIELAEIRVK